MKIMQVMPEFGLAGAEIMCENLMVGLKELGHEVFAVSLYDYHSPITERLERNEIKIFYLNKKQGLDLSIYQKLYKIIKREMPDVVHTHRYVMQYATPVAKFCRIKKNIHTVHSIAQKEQEPGKRKLARFFYHYWSVIPVALTKEIQTTIMEEYGLPEERIPIVFNGESLKRFSPKENYQIGDAFKLLHIGRFQPLKNQMLIVECTAELIEAGLNLEVFLVGDNDNSYGEEVKEAIIAHHLENKIHLVGLQSDVAPMLSQVDLFVLPSQYEGMPMTLIEAMATGLPVIASAVGGIVDMMNNNENGLLIQPDKSSLIRSIKELYDNGQLRMQLGMQARKRSLSFSSEAMASSYIEIYKG